MPTTSTTGTGQVPPESQSPDGNGQVPPTSQDATTAQGDSGHSEPSSKLTYEQLEDRNKKLAAENAQRRIDAKELAELRAYRQEQEDAKLSDAQKHEKQRAADQERIAELELAKQEASIRADIKLAAADLGISVKLARLILTDSYAQIAFDENGDPTNVADLLRAAVEEHGITAGAGVAAANAAPSNASTRNGSQPHVSSGGAVNPGRSNTSNNGLFDGDPQTVAARFARMSPSEYAQHSHEYTAWLINNQRKLTGR